MNISLIEFVNKRKDELDRFATQWMIYSQQDPENWPLFLEKIEWREQEKMLFIPNDFSNDEEQP